MTENADKSGLGGDECHPSVQVFSGLTDETYADIGISGTLLGRFGMLLFPYSLRKYPGRIRAASRLLCLTVSSYDSYGKPAGDKRLSPAVARRAEKICRALIDSLSVLANDLAKHAADMETNRAPVRRGFLTVRVRDESGIPRNAQGHGKRNGIIPAEKSLTGHKPKSF